MIRMGGNDLMVKSVNDKSTWCFERQKLTFLVRRERITVWGQQDLLFPSKPNDIGFCEKLLRGLQREAVCQGKKGLRITVIDRKCQQNIFVNR